MPALLLCFTAGPLPSELIQLWRKLGAFLPAHHWLQQQQNMTVVLQHYVSQQGSDFCDFGEEGEVPNGLVSHEGIPDPRGIWLSPFY